MSYSIVTHGRQKATPTCKISTKVLPFSEHLLSRNLCPDPLKADNYLEYAAYLQPKYDMRSSLRNFSQNTMEEIDMHGVVGEPPLIKFWCYERPFYPQTTVALG